MFAYTAVNRVGLSVAIPALSAAALRAVPTDKLARGTSSSNFFLTLGGGFVGCAQNFIMRSIIQRNSQQL